VDDDEAPPAQHHGPDVEEHDGLAAARLGAAQGDRDLALEQRADHPRDERLLSVVPQRALKGQLRADRLADGGVVAARLAEALVEVRPRHAEDARLLARRLVLAVRLFPDQLVADHCISQTPRAGHDLGWAQRQLLANAV
jgi:hypothetical protein